MYLICVPLAAIHYSLAIDSSVCVCVCVCQMHIGNYTQPLMKCVLKYTVIIYSIQSYTARIHVHIPVSIEAVYFSCHVVQNAI